MKKLVVVLSVMLVGYVSIAAQVDSSQFTEKVYNNSKEILDKVMINSGKAVSTGYDIIVQQQRVIAVEYTLVFIGSMICFLLFLNFYKKSNKVESETPVSKNTLFPAIIFLGLSIWLGIVFSFHFTDVIQGFVNPDYAAIKDIISMFGKFNK